MSHVEIGVVAVSNEDIRCFSRVNVQVENRYYVKEGVFSFEYHLARLSWILFFHHLTRPSKMSTQDEEENLVDYEEDEDTTDKKSDGKEIKKCVILF